LGSSLAKAKIMNSSWVSNNNSVDRVKALLEQAGLPLELSVASICNDFCNSHDKRPAETGFWTEKVVYSNSQNKDDYRELDQKTTIYDEFEVGKSTHIQLQLQIPIECKYRKDLEIFAFPLIGNSSYKRFPICSPMKGSQLFASLVEVFEQFSDINICSPVFLEIKGGETPQKVHDENLAYNAAGALYDFILTDLVPDNASPTGLADEIVEKSGLVDEFRKYIDQTNYSWTDVLARWISSIDKKQFDSFNKKYFDSFRKYLHMVSVHMPVICMNAPIYKVNWATKDGIESFQEIPYFITSIIKHGWPGLAYVEILSRNPEVPVIITNPNNLLGVLELGKEWYTNLRARLTNAPESITRRWALESSLSS
jgi:hypothetical protein